MWRNEHYCDPDLRLHTNQKMGGKGSKEGNEEEENVAEHDSTHLHMQGKR